VYIRLKDNNKITQVGNSTLAITETPSPTPIPLSKPPTKRTQRKKPKKMIQTNSNNTNSASQLAHPARTTPTNSRQPFSNYIVILSKDEEYQAFASHIVILS